MRKVLDPQLMFGEVDIGAIQLSTKSRDDIPQLLRGLQYIYTTPALRARVFEILKEVVPQRAEGEGKASLELGRPGMEQWRILVLGVLRLALNADYDRVLELANHHKVVRQMLGHSGWNDGAEEDYSLQTLKDNIQLFTPAILERINQEVVRGGHDLVKKGGSPKSSAPLKARIDSFVVETDVHYPTDINLLWDAIRKTVQICARFCEERGMSEWRQSQYNLRQFKRLYRKAQKLKHSTSKDETKRQQKQAAVQEAHRIYIEAARHNLQRAQSTRAHLEKVAQSQLLLAFQLKELDTFMGHAERQIDQIRRRVLQGEVIPQAEKVYSLFQPHTEWISKGKAGVPVELGLAVCVVEDQHRFILTHQVMEKITDKDVAVPIVEQTLELYDTLGSVSLDKGFHSPENQTQLKEFVERVVLPKKGKLSAAERERESDPEFIRLRQQHSAVESAINALEVHGLDRCLDHGRVGFKRYVALAVVARNIHRLGGLLRQQQLDRTRGPYKKAA